MYSIISEKYYDEDKGITHCKQVFLLHFQLHFDICIDRGMNMHLPIHTMSTETIVFIIWHIMCLIIATNVSIHSSKWNFLSIPAEKFPCILKR